jgi:glutaredoxin
MSAQGYPRRALRRRCAKAGANISHPEALRENRMFKFLITVVCVGLIGLASLSAQAQMYRWTDQQGHVHYTDSPPPKDALEGEEKHLSGNVASGGDVPYATREAIKNAPVILFTAEACKAPCDDGRKLLNQRGIPYRDVKVDDEASRAQLKQYSASAEVPVLIVGRDVRKGFLATDWNAALDAAGYLRSSGAPSAKNKVDKAPPSANHAPKPMPGKAAAPAAEPAPAGPYTPR